MDQKEFIVLIKLCLRGDNGAANSVTQNVFKAVWVDLCNNEDEVDCSTANEWIFEAKSLPLMPSKSKNQLFEEQNVAIEKMFQRLDDNSNGTLEKSEVMGAALTDPELSKYISPGRAMMLQKQMFVPMTLPMFKEFCNPSNTNKKTSSGTKTSIVAPLNRIKL